MKSLKTALLAFFFFFSNSTWIFAQPSHEKLDEITSSLNTLQKKVDNLKDISWIREVGPTSVAFVGLIASVIISVVSLNRNASLTRQTILEKSREEERKSIREKLDQFYGPFEQLRGVSKHLYEIFTAGIPEDMKNPFRDGDGKFRTLIALIHGHKFHGIEKNLLEEIVKLGSESEKLILEKVGLVDDPDLQKLLWKAATHYRIIRLANEDKLTGGGPEFESFTFPYALDPKIADKMKSLNNRLEELRKM